jgi:hypothetical protein
MLKINQLVLCAVLFQRKNSRPRSHELISQISQPFSSVFLSQQISDTFSHGLLAKSVFFSHNKSANSTFQLVFSAK